jgi:glycosyltransferase involved in cell wall biosynthesis
MLSIVVPTFNEIKNGYLTQILENLKKLSDTEILFVDSYSTDGTAELIQSYEFRVISHKTTSRGERLSVGAKEARGELIFFHHPRTIYDNEGLKYLSTNSKELKWGGFTHSFDKEHKLLKFTSWYSNDVRADEKNIFYLDHGIFVTKSLLKRINYVASVDVFEDTLLSLALRAILPGERLDFKATTSAVRFEQNGIIRQMALNLWMKILFHFKSDHRKMNFQYEKGSRLNTTYKENKDD